MKISTKNKKGKLKQNATVFSNDPQKPKTKIFINGSIKQLITVKPGNRVLLQGHVGDKISKKVTITSLEEQPLEITDITSTIDDKIKYKLKNIQKGKKYSLEIKTRLSIKEPFHGKVVLKTNSRKKPEIDIFVVGKVQGMHNH